MFGDYLFLGEVFFDGILWLVVGVLFIVVVVYKMGIIGLVVFIGNVKEAVVVKGLLVYGFDNIFNVIDFLNSFISFFFVEINIVDILVKWKFIGLDLKEVKG